MMKKLNKGCLILLLATILTGTSLLTAGTISVGAHGGYNFFTGDTFRDIYGSGAFTFGLNGSLKVFPLISLEGAIDYYSTSGKTAVTQSEISFSCTTIRLGGSFSLSAAGIAPKVGAGLAYHMIDENDPWGGSSKAKMSWYAAAGVDFNLTGPFTIGGELLYLDYSLEGDFGDTAISYITFLITFKFKL